MDSVKGRVITLISLAIVLVIFVGMIVTVAIYSHFDVDSRQVFIDGTYSVDGGEWKDTLPDKMSDEQFRTLKIKGRLSHRIVGEQLLTISVKNAWFSLEADNKLVSTNRLANDKTALKDTPGCDIYKVAGSTIRDSKELELTVSYPYPMFSDRNLSQYLTMYVGNSNTMYELLFNNQVLNILFCILICFFGLFAFPIAGIVLGGVDYRYLAFAILCFFLGIFLLTQRLYNYMPLWIDDPVMCMTLCESTDHIFGICALSFIRVILEQRVHKVIGNITILAFSAAVVASLILSQTGFLDMYAGSPFVQIFFAVCALALTVCLIRELKTNRMAFSVLISWIPLALTLLYDIVNAFLGITEFDLFEIGAAVTLFNQLVQLVFDLRRQYKETIRYQEMQKELYEAKVSLMVSQIQPHFLYNSLTSIAMMCTKDPQTAKKATINFADYLRGNMNSLKERKPVPFERELEHLKKYLMLEQMRFGDLLNIEYDIQATNFSIPLLSVQPLVENAVKHGVGMKEDGGTVQIATRETDNAFEVIVTDNGVGFDTTRPKNDGRSHVGMENVTQRLKELCNAEVVIESTIGEGTIAKIIIPKENNKE